MSDVRMPGWLWRSAAIVGAATLGFVVLFALSMMGCAGGGGWICSTDAESQREAATTAIVAAVGIGPLVAVTFTRDLRWLALTAVTTGLAGAGLAAAAAASAT